MAELPPFTVALKEAPGPTGAAFAQPFGLSHSFAAMPATWRPWKRAIFSSTSLGMRAPLAPAIVEAP